MAACAIWHHPLLGSAVKVSLDNSKKLWSLHAITGDVMIGLFKNHTQVVTSIALPPSVLRDICVDAVADLGVDCH